MSNVVVANEVSPETDKVNQTAMEMIREITRAISLNTIPSDILLTNANVTNQPIDTTGSKVVYLLETKKEYGKNFVLRDDFKYDYNELGLLDKFIRKSFRVEERVLQWTDFYAQILSHYVILYQYDAYNNCTVMISVKPTGELLSSVYKKFDNRGKVTEYDFNWIYPMGNYGGSTTKNVHLGYNDAGLIDYYKDDNQMFLYKYDKYSNIVEKITYNYLKVLKEYAYFNNENFTIQYDKTGKIVKINNVSFSYENGGKIVIADYSEKLSFKTYYNYKKLFEKDNQGRLIRKEFINKSYPIGDCHKEEYKYDELGRRVKYEYSAGYWDEDNKDAKWFLKSSENQIFDQNKLKRIETFSMDFSTGKLNLTSAVDYDYNQTGSLSSIEFFKVQNQEFLPYKKRVLEYDEFGNLTTDYNYAKVGSDYVFTAGTANSYKSFQYKKPEIILPDMRLIPNPAISYIEILSLPEPVNLSIFNSGGVLMKNCIINPNQRISVQDLPKGIYFYSYISGNQHINGRFMKTEY